MNQKNKNNLQILLLVLGRSNQPVFLQNKGLRQSTLKNIIAKNKKRPTNLGQTHWLAKVSQAEN